MEHVCISHNILYKYPPHSGFLYAPSKKYPEYMFDQIDDSNSNDVYDCVRECFHDSGLDIKQYGTKDWNPLGEYIKPHSKVVIKPNWVFHKNSSGYGIECMLTHTSIIKALIDYIIIALNNNGEIIIGDAPMAGCDLNKVLTELKVYELIDFYNQNCNVKIRIEDFRDYTRSNNVLTHNKSDGILVDLGKKSAFEGLSPKKMKRLRVLTYSPEKTSKMHGQGHHYYLINKYVLSADVVINVPKVKTHMKAGMTACSKNFVGICSQKDYLAHHTLGGAAARGDEYKNPNLFKWLYARITDEFYLNGNKNKYYGIILRKTRTLLKKIIENCSSDKTNGGSWYGNDTIWRTISDLNYAILYADANGIIHQGNKQRRVLNICDMIIAGQGNGPIAPVPKHFGAIVFSDNSTAADYVICKSMGFDPGKIKYIPRLMSVNNIHKNDIAVVVNHNKVSVDSLPLDENWRFEPAPFWKGHIED